MRVMDGASSSTQAAAAVAEACGDWEESPEIVFAFASTAQDPIEVAQALTARFPDSVIAGCTTSGEHISGEHYRGALVMSGLYDTGMRWRIATIPDIAGFDQGRADEVVGELMRSLDVSDFDRCSVDDYVAIVMIDGLSCAEERVSSHLAEALQGVPLVGGSAGDDLAFAQTFVFSNEGASSGAAILVIAERGEASISVLKHQHFVATPSLLAITSADPATRTVHEIDGRRPIEAYADALSMRVEEVTADVAFLHPLTFCYDGQLYVRSVQTINDDGSLTFYCGIEEGMVLDVATSSEIGVALEHEVNEIAAARSPADFVLGFNCILRALEAESNQAHERLGGIMSRLGKHVLGFDTYGEQLDGLHINQTLVALSIRGTGPAELKEAS